MKILEITFTGLSASIAEVGIIVLAFMCLFLGIIIIGYYTLQFILDMIVKYSGMAKGVTNIYRYYYDREKFKEWHKHRMFYKEMLFQETHKAYIAAHPEYYDQNGFEKPTIENE